MIAMDIHPLPLAQEPSGGSYLVILHKATDALYPLTPALGLAIFFGAIFVVAMNRRPAVIASYLLFVPLPWLLGLFGALRIVGQMCDQINYGVRLQQEEIAKYMSEPLSFLLLGLVATIPAYLVVAIGLFVRTLARGTRRTGKRPGMGRLGPHRFVPEGRLKIAQHVATRSVAVLGTRQAIASRESRRDG